MYRVMANVLAWTNKIVLVLVLVLLLVLVLVLVLVLETGADDFAGLWARTTKCLSNLS
jgi:hypothetical protein